MDEERAQDDHQHHREYQQQVAGFGKEILLNRCATDEDGKGENDGANKYGYTGASLLEFRGLEGLHRLC